MSSNKFRILSILVTVLLLAACKRSISVPLPEILPTEQSTSEMDTPTPTQTSTLAPEETPEVEDSPTPTATDIPPTPTPIPPTATSTPVPETAEPTPVPTQVSGAIGEVWNLADVRYGFHDTWLRVVIEMVEVRASMPYYEIKEVENATVPYPTGHDPSWGESRIDLVISDLYAYDAPIYGELPIDPGENPIVTKIGKYPTFDDALLGFSIGLKSPAEFTVFELTDPVRIVIDVYYP